MLGHRSIGEGALSALLAGQVTVTQTLTVRFASMSFVTRATDAPAHEFIDGRIGSGLRLGRGIKSGEAGQFGSLLETTFGEIALLNNDGALDSLVNSYYADGLPLRLKIGATEVTSLGRERVQPFADFALVYSSIAGEWSFEHDLVRLRIAGSHSAPSRFADRHNVGRLQDRLQQQTYSGAGGQQGTADMAGRTVPTAFGTCLNASAQLVDPAILSYQLHGGTMDSIIAVYDAGIALAFDADYASYAALEAATVPAGSYASSLATGFIRLGTTPIGAVTADIRGDNQTFDARGYVADHGGLIKKVLLNYSNLVTADLDEDSFDDLDTAQPASMGLFLPAGDQSTVEEVIARVALSCGAFAGQDRSGLYRVQRLEAPATSQHWTFTDRDIISIERERLPYGVPWKSWGVGYQINWTVQHSSDLAAGVTQARRTFLEAEYRYAYAQDPAIALAHATSSGAPLRSSLFLDVADAEDEAERLIAFYALGRAMYRIVVKTALFSVEIGQTVRVLYDRWDLGGGKNFVVIEADDDADAVTTELLVFG